MVEVVKVYTQQSPKLRLIGRKYADSDRGPEGSFGAQWGAWFEAGDFAKLEALRESLPGGAADIPDADAYIGLMRWKEGEPFEYWIGMFFPEDTSIPEGFEAAELEAGELGTCWLYGPEYEIYSKEELAMKRLEEEGYRATSDQNGAMWFFERYVCPRFTTPDEQGNVVLDICLFVEKA